MNFCNGCAEWTSCYLGEAIKLVQQQSARHVFVTPILSCMIHSYVTDGSGEVQRVDTCSIHVPTGKMKGLVCSYQQYKHYTKHGQVSASRHEMLTWHLGPETQETHACSELAPNAQQIKGHNIRSRGCGAQLLFPENKAWCCWVAVLNVTCNANIHLGLTSGFAA